MFLSALNGIKSAELNYFNFPWFFFKTSTISLTQNKILWSRGTFSHDHLTNDQWPAKFLHFWVWCCKSWIVETPIKSFSDLTWRQVQRNTTLLLCHLTSFPVAITCKGHCRQWNLKLYGKVHQSVVLLKFYKKNELCSQRSFTRKKAFIFLPYRPTIHFLRRRKNIELKNNNRKKHLPMKRLCLVCHVYQVLTRNGNSPSLTCILN